MNKERRKRLTELRQKMSTAISPEMQRKIDEVVEILEGLGGSLAEIREGIESVRDDETEAKDNRPETMQGDEVDDLMQTGIDFLEEAISKLEEVEGEVTEVSELKTKIEDLVEQIDEAAGSVDAAIENTN